MTYRDLKIHLVAIAKNEELYIEDWMIHYFKLGFDKICIYDNNDYSNSEINSKNQLIRIMTILLQKSIQTTQLRKIN